jgi:hypothetical protein
MINFMKNNQNNILAFNKGTKIFLIQKLAKYCHKYPNTIHINLMFCVYQNKILGAHHVYNMQAVESQ